MSSTFSLLDLLKGNDIKGLIFDKFGQKHHFRLFPYKQNLFGSFEAYIIYDSINVRYQSLKLKDLVLTDQDKSVVLYAFLHRESLGIADGMGDISNPNFNVERFSPGTREDNYIFNRDTLLKLYGNLDQFKDVKIPLPKALQQMLSLPMSHCYFDKTPIDGSGSICINCAQELKNEGYEVPEKFISQILSAKPQ